jgi:hypothetical protein
MQNIFCVPRPMWLRQQEKKECLNRLSIDLRPLKNIFQDFLGEWHNVRPSWHIGRSAAIYCKFLTVRASHVGHKNLFAKVATKRFPRWTNGF